MNRDDALDVIALIMACWPQAQSMTDDAANVWITKLAPYELDDSVRAIEWLHDRLDFPPSWAQFREAHRLVQPRVTYTAPALDAPAVPANRNVERIRRLRTVAAVIGTPDDRHRGTAGRREQLAGWVLDGGPPPDGITLTSRSA